MEKFRWLLRCFTHELFPLLTKCFARSFSHPITKVFPRQLRQFRFWPAENLNPWSLMYGNGRLASQDVMGIFDCPAICFPQWNSTHFSQIRLHWGLK